MGEGRRFGIWKFFKDTNTATIRLALETLEAEVHSWNATDPKFRFATQLASQFGGQFGSQRLRMLVKTTAGEERWFVRVLCTRIPHLTAAVEYTDAETRNVRYFPSTGLAEFLLQKQTVEIVAPEPGKTSRGFTAQMYVRYKLRTIPGGRELLETPVGTGAKALAGQLFEAAQEVFKNGGIEKSSISTRPRDIRRFLESCDRLLLREAERTIVDGVARMTISPDVWFDRG